MTGTMDLTVQPVLRRRLLILAGLAFALWASWKVSVEEVPQKIVAERIAPSRKPASNKPVAVAPSLPLEWPERESVRRAVDDLFSLAPPLPVGPPAPLQSSPTVPALKLKYVGRLDRGDNGHVFLTDAQDRVISTKVGEPLADGWQLSAADAKHLVFRHIASGQEQTMQIGTVQ
jgi:hypothetical protein